LRYLIAFYNLFGILYGLDFFYSCRSPQNAFCNPSKVYLIITSALTHVWTSFCGKFVFSRSPLLAFLVFMFFVLCFSLHVMEDCERGIKFTYFLLISSFLILAQVAGRIKQKLGSLQKERWSC
jgi:hypothetical protein